MNWAVCVRLLGFFSRAFLMWILFFASLFLNWPKRLLAEIFLFLSSTIQYEYEHARSTFVHPHFQFTLLLIATVLYVLWWNRKRVASRRFLCCVFYVHAACTFILFFFSLFSHLAGIFFPSFVEIVVVVVVASCFIILKSNEHFVEIAIVVDLFRFALSFASFIIIIIFIKAAAATTTATTAASAHIRWIYC